MNRRELILKAAALGLSLPAVTKIALADTMEDAKAYLAKYASKQDTWDGPTTGPKAAKGKTIVIVANDLKNSGVRATVDAAAEAAKIIGWTIAGDRRRGLRIGPHCRARPGHHAEARRHRGCRPRPDRAEGRSGRSRKGRHRHGRVAFGAEARADRGNDDPGQCHQRTAWRTDRGRDMGVPGRRRQAGRRHLHR